MQFYSFRLSFIFCFWQEVLSVKFFVDFRKIWIFCFCFCFCCLLKLDTGGCHPSWVRLSMFHLFVSVSRPMQFSSPLWNKSFKRMLSADSLQFCNQKFWLEVLEWVMVERRETLYVPHMLVVWGFSFFFLFHKLVKPNFTLLVPQTLGLPNY